MKQIYLHLGFHKTATTSFQETCKRNVISLREQGYSYPLFNSEYFVLNNTANHSVPIYSIFNENLNEYNIGIRQNIFDFEKLGQDSISYLKDCLASNMNLILSAEDASLRLSQDKLLEFKELLLSYSYEVIPIVFVRSPYEYHCSFIQQDIRGGEYKDLTKFISQREKIVKIQKVFPNTQFIPFKEACEHKDGPTGFMLDLIGVEFKNFKMVRANEGSSNIFIRAQNFLNKNEPREISNTINDKWVNLCKDNKDLFKNKFLLNETEFNELRSDFNKENVFFKENLGNEFLDTNIQFSNSENCFEEMSDYLSSRTIINDKYVNSLRDTALMLETENLRTAHDLMELAHIIRPKGPFIKQKLDEYKDKLNIQN